MSRKKTIILVSILAYAVIMVLALTLNIIPFFKNQKEMKAEEASAKQLVEKINEPDIVKQPAEQALNVVTISPTPEKEFVVLEKYKQMLDTYPDVVGKVKIDDTNIDYMVVQTIDNEYYLDKDYDKNKSKSGAIYMDYGSKVDELSENLKGNIVLYGHNMKVGTMFHNLRYYMDEDYAKKHNIIQFDTLGEDLKWEVFSVYNETAVNGCIGNDTVFSNDDGFEALKDELIKKSKIDMGINSVDGESILTLITCDYSFDDGRLFVHAKLVE
jgi:sortase B